MKILTRGGGGYGEVDLFPTGVPATNATVGASVLSAASMVSGNIFRSGSTGAYSDTTDTAVAILAALGNPPQGTSVHLTIVNGVAFVETVVAGVGVTLAGVTANAASAVRDYLITVTSPTTVTLTGIGSRAA